MRSLIELDIGHHKPGTEVAQQNPPPDDVNHLPGVVWQPLHENTEYMEEHMILHACTCIKASYTNQSISGNTAGKVVLHLSVMNALNTGITKLQEMPCCNGNDHLIAGLKYVHYTIAIISRQNVYHLAIYITHNITK